MHIFFRNTLSEDKKAQDKNLCKLITKTQNNNHNKSLVVFHQNIDRLRKKVDRLAHYLQLFKPDVVVLTEHGLKDLALNNVQLPDYSLVTAYCREKRKKGGVAILKHNSIANEVESIDIMSHCEELVCEMAAVKIVFEKRNNLYILGVYRPPDAPLDNALTLLTSALSNLPCDKNDICIVGDFNVNCLIPSRKNSTFHEALALFDITRIPLPPTRITSTSSTSIDIICTNLNNGRIKTEVTNTGLSDHTGQFCHVQVKLKTNNPSTAIYRQLNTSNLQGFKELLALQSWERVYRADSAEDAYTIFIDTLSVALDITCPKKKFKSRKNNRKEFKNPEANQLRKDFILAQDKYHQSGREEHRLEALDRKRTYDLKLRSLRREANENFIAESNDKSKAIWRIINSERLTKKQTTNSTWQLDIAGKVIEDPDDLCGYFNMFFANIADETLKQNNQNKHPISAVNTLFTGTALTDWRIVSHKELFNTINSLKSTSSSGIDGISSKLLKYCIDEVSQPLTDIINKSLSQGVFPSKLKISKVYPLHKQGSKKEVKNYRPISLIPTVSKIIEKIVLVRILEHLNFNNLLPDRQHGFIPGKSTMSAITDLIEHIIDDLEKGNTVTSVFLDLSKAFDCLDHYIIVQKLKSLGFQGNTARWFESYLTGREQIVEVKQNLNGVE